MNKTQQEDPKPKPQSAPKMSDEERQIAADIVTIVSTEAGKRFFWRMMGLTKVFETSFTGNSETFFNEGRRAVGLTMLNEIVKYAPSEYVKMISADMKGSK